MRLELHRGNTSLLSAPLQELLARHPAARRASHLAPEPARPGHRRALPLLRHDLAMPVLRHPARLSPGPRAARLPPLRLSRSAAPRLPVLRRPSRLLRRGHPAGRGGGAPRSFLRRGCCAGIRTRSGAPAVRTDCCARSSGGRSISSSARRWSPRGSTSPASPPSGSSTPTPVCTSPISARANGRSAC